MEEIIKQLIFDDWETSWEFIKGAFVLFFFLIIYFVGKYIGMKI
jgi:hypothetical protein